MLTRLRVRNFKRFEEIDVELGDPVVFVGPNNSGKTTAMQALALWDCGLRTWSEKYADRAVPAKRPGVTVGRRDIVSVPVPTARLLWRNQSVRHVSRDSGRQITSNILIEVLVDGVSSDGTEWQCGMEFDYANPESVYCRSMLVPGSNSERMSVPAEVLKTPTAFLGPMSGLAANEARLDPGAIDVRIGEGRTADVLRNICYALWESDRETWESVVRRLRTLSASTSTSRSICPSAAKSPCRTASAGAPSTCPPVAGECSRRFCSSLIWVPSRARSFSLTSRTHISRSFVSGTPTAPSRGPRTRRVGR